MLLRDAAAVDAAAAAMLCTYETWHMLLYSRPPSSSIRERKFNKEDQYGPPGNLLRERLLTTAGAKPQTLALSSQPSTTSHTATPLRMAAIQRVPVRHDVAVVSGPRRVLARLLPAQSSGVRAAASAAGGRRHLLERAALLLVPPDPFTANTEPQTSPPQHQSYTFQVPPFHAPVGMVPLRCRHRRVHVGTAAASRAVGSSY